MKTSLSLNTSTLCAETKQAEIQKASTIFEWSMQPTLTLQETDHTRTSYKTVSWYHAPILQRRPGHQTAVYQHGRSFVVRPWQENQRIVSSYHRKIQFLWPRPNEQGSWPPKPTYLWQSRSGYKRNDGYNVSFTCRQYLSGLFDSNVHRGKS